MEAKFVKIKSLTRKVQKTSVWDLTVEDNENFFTDVGLVHNCPHKCSYCLPSGTKILMADGKEKVAERVRKGDKIMSYNTETQKPEYAEVTETLSRKAPGVMVIETETTTLRATPEHPIFTKRGWVDAGQITEEDEVLVW